MSSLFIKGKAMLIISRDEAPLWVIELEGMAVPNHPGMISFKHTKNKLFKG